MSALSAAEKEVLTPASTSCICTLEVLAAEVVEMEAMLAEKEVDIELFKNRDLSCTDEDPGYAAEVLPTPVAWSS